MIVSDGNQYTWDGQYIGPQQDDYVMSLHGGGGSGGCSGACGCVAPDCDPDGLEVGTHVALQIIAFEDDGSWKEDFAGSCDSDRTRFGWEITS